MSNANANIFLAEQADIDRLNALVKKVTTDFLNMTPQEMDELKKLNEKNAKQHADRAPKLEAIKKDVVALKISFADIFPITEISEEFAFGVVASLQDHFKFGAEQLGFTGGKGKGKTTAKAEGETKHRVAKPSASNIVLFQGAKPAKGRQPAYNQGRVYENATDTVKKPFYPKVPEFLVAIAKDEKTLLAAAVSDEAKAYLATEEGKAEVKALVAAVKDQNLATPANPFKKEEAPAQEAPKAEGGEPKADDKAADAKGTLHANKGKGKEAAAA